MEILSVPISRVQVWEKNLKTRATKTADYERTKKQIEDLGVYKPVIVFAENGTYFVLGGRTRYYVLKDLNHENIDISLVHPKTDAEKMKFVFSDNDHSGIWLEEALAEEVYAMKEEIDLEDFKIELREPVSLKELIGNFSPEEGGSNINPNNGQDLVCPKCGHKWRE